MLARAAHSRRRAARPHADHQRLAARAQGRRAEGRRPAPRHGEPRRARRRDLPPHERRRLPGRRRAARHRRRRARRPRPDQGQHGRQARHQRRRDPADGTPLPRPRRGAALHRVHGRRRDQRLAHGRGAAVERGRARASRDEFALVAAAARRRPARPPSAGATPRPASLARSARSRASRKAFCGDCNRARLSTEGKLFLCLFASRGHDLRALVRGGASDAEIAAAIGPIWQQRSDRYSELRGRAQAADGAGERRVEMHYIGG